MSYDRLGRLLTAANAHSTITRSYDPAGRQLSETQDHTNGPAGTFQYQYDSDGQLARHIRPDGSYIDYQYNQRNLLSNLISDAPPPVATYTYNGRKTPKACRSFGQECSDVGRSPEAPCGGAESNQIEETVIEYDRRFGGRLDRPEGGPARGEFAELGQIHQNGLFTATRTYDNAGRLTGVSNGTLDTTAYTLSPDGRRTAIAWGQRLSAPTIAWHNP